MTDSPDEIRADIERTRRDLGEDVDALADKVSPAKIVDRQMGRVRGALGSVRERVMGTADDAAASLGDVGSHAGEVKDRVVAKVEGNPLAVGLIAFGAGVLIASLIPASSKEKDLAASVKEQSQPLIEEVTEVAKDVGGNLKEPARAAFTSVKESAQDSVATVKEETQTAVDEVKDQAEHARQHVSEA